MIGEKEKLKLLIDHLDSIYSKKIIKLPKEQQKGLIREHWDKYNQLVGDNLESWYDYIFWLTVQIGE